MPRRLPEPVEVAAYYLVSEALTNTCKHADASMARVDLDLDERALHVCVCDDGCGGADASRGSGIVGLRDRVEAAGGWMDVDSPRGKGTALRATLPL